MNADDSTTTIDRRKHLREYVKLKLDEYGTMFTIHGLSKGIYGGRIEKTAWLSLVALGVLIGFIILQGLIAKYLKYSAYTEIRSEIADPHFFPSITFCEEQLLFDAYFAYCGVGPRFANRSDERVCTPAMYSKYAEADVKTTNDGYWDNGLFQVNMCQGRDPDCDNSKAFRSLRSLNNSCIRWNYNGDIYGIHSRKDIRMMIDAPPLLFRAPPRLIAIPHDPRITELDFTAKIDLDPFKIYEIKFDKTIVKRLPAPFPSNCSTGKHGDMLPGAYSRHSCIETHNYIEMLKVCGDVPDYAREYIPKELVEKYGQNKTIKDFLTCTVDYGGKHYNFPFECSFPCVDMDLSIVSSRQEDLPDEYQRKDKGKDEDNDRYFYHFTIQYQSVDTYTVMEEKPLYMWDQLACEIGGIIGVLPEGGGRSATKDLVSRGIDGMAVTVNSE